LLAQGSPELALDTAIAAIRMLSLLRFGSGRAAEPFAAVWRRLQATITAIARLQPSLVRAEAVVGLYEACASADGHVGVRPWFGHAFTAAADIHLAAGWGSAEVRVGSLDDFHSAIFGADCFFCDQPGFPANNWLPDLP
jgi:hypothetical protein